MNKRILFIVLLISLSVFLLVVGIALQEENAPQEENGSDETLNDVPTSQEDPFTNIFEEALDNNQQIIREVDIPKGLQKEKVCIIEGEVVQRGTIVSGGTCVPNEVSPTVVP